MSSSPSQPATQAAEKLCSKCGKEKAEGLFTKNPKSAECRICHNARKTRERKVRESAWTPEQIAEKASKTKARGQKWLGENRQHASSKSLEYYHKNKGLIRDRINKRAKLDPMFILKRNVRKALKRAYDRVNSHKNDESQEILGCDWLTLQTHLISTAIARYGVWLECETYEIDHRIPLSRAGTEDDVICLSHYKNLQLLTKRDNRTKSDMDEEEWQRRQSRN